MTIDKSLRRGSRLSRSRNVLKRDERIDVMKANDRFISNQSPLGLPKTRVEKSVTGKKKKAKGGEGDDK